MLLVDLVYFQMVQAKSPVMCERMVLENRDCNMPEVPKTDSLFRRQL